MGRLALTDLFSAIEGGTPIILLVGGHTVFTGLKMDLQLKYYELHAKNIFLRDGFMVIVSAEDSLY